MLREPMEIQSNKSSEQTAEHHHPDGANARRIQWIVTVCGMALLALVGGMRMTASRRVPAELLVHARELADTGRTPEAISELERDFRSFKSVPDQVSAHELLGDLYRQVSKYDHMKFIPQYEKAVALDPNNGRLQFKAASSAFGLEQRQASAIAGLERSLELGYTNVDTFYMLGSAKKQEGDSSGSRQEAAKSYIAAMEWYRQALRVDDKHLPSLGNAGDIMFNLGMYPQAADIYRRVLDLPQEPAQTVTILSRLAHTEIRLGHYDTAATVLDKAQAKLLEIPAQVNPVANAMITTEGLQILVYRMEMAMTMGDQTGAIAVCEALRAGVADARKKFTNQGFTLDSLASWEQEAQENLKRLQK